MPFVLLLSSQRCPAAWIMLAKGAHWAVARLGEMRDLERIEEQGRMVGARPDCVSDRAKERQRREMGTLGSGNHYLEVQAMPESFDMAVADAFGLAQDVGAVVAAAEHAGLARSVARLRPLICIKG
ncbi:RtcB family protein [Bradyrhizobium sediminis]|uniref:3'-phosphate/5'-hydroxy nucleic acid ligase n=1 Tax=Bradyrhizobium sediminis TaxID=2840469 RepID=A0A975NS29_9BRAD|nr:RtcB family protein [Bradyrhizobium sediminis]QWG20242.1 RtcB family protein [Bradyrhizobium sediminis]